MTSITYIAFLRGINVGGNNIIKMTLLKETFERCGYKNVSTYIQSGNVIFESEEKNTQKITNDLENELSKTFAYKAKLVILSHGELMSVLTNTPKEWKTSKDFRCYVAFTKEPVTPDEVIKEVKLKEGIDFIKSGTNVVYMSTLLSGLTKSGFTRLIGTKVYQYITIRNYNTIQKILSLMG
ncbi:MAG: DUF1697 domain-containing protein [Candidatus Roizmanbacteria bacterium]|nr:DUF1697 domain-containing protein [Candidatus Roizmanbacteria bacterium]